MLIKVWTLKTIFASTFIYKQTYVSTTYIEFNLFVTKNTRFRQNTFAKICKWLLGK